MKIDLSQKNPFSSYASNFARNFTFGEDFDAWVSRVMLTALVGDAGWNKPIRLADIGAGSCYWATLFLSKLPNARIVAIDPSEELILRQAVGVVGERIDAGDRLERRSQTAQAFAQAEHGEPYHGIYFMQSAHYVAHNEFKSVFSGLAKLLHKEGGRIVIQARNMTPDWYPWAFPDEWIPKVEEALHATDMFFRADRYAKVFREMTEIFRHVEVRESSTEVRVDCEEYWQRLEDRWIPTFMSPDIIAPELHRHGIDAMKRRFAAAGRKSVGWTEKFALVSAYV